MPKTDELVEAVANAIEKVPVMCGTYSMDGEDAEALAKAAIGAARPLIEADVLRKVEQHLSACQYEPAPYTCLKTRLGNLAKQGGSYEKP